MVIHFSFLSSPNSCHQPSQSASDPLLTDLRHSALHCVSHEDIVLQLFCSTDVLASYTAGDRSLISPVGAPKPSASSPRSPPRDHSFCCAELEMALPTGNRDAQPVLPSRIHHQPNQWVFLLKCGFPDYYFFKKIQLLCCPTSIADNQWFILALHLLFNYSHRNVFFGFGKKKKKKRCSNYIILCACVKKDLFVRCERKECVWDTISPPPPQNSTWAHPFAPTFLISLISCLLGENTDGPGLCLSL